MEIKTTILGCGSSSGVPMVGCDCAVCTSGNPKNQRTRASVFVQAGNAHLLIDTSPDLRAQALANNLRRVDAILYTHAHADHCHGLDEVRNFNYLAGGPLPAYADRATYEELLARFPYAFREPPQMVWSRPALMYHEIATAPCRPFEVNGVQVVPFPQKHGRVDTLGFRIGNMAYSTDVHEMVEEGFAALEGVDLWIVDCLRVREAPTHAWLARTLEWIARVKPKQAVLTHMGHEIDYEALARQLPEGVIPAYDGLVLRA